MSTSSQFIIALHILVYLTMRKKSTSDQIAESVNTNPVVIRRTLGKLRVAGLVQSQTGPSGGYTLAQSPEHITLRDIYDTVEEGPLFHMHYTDPSDSCPVGSIIQDCLGDLVDEAKEAVRSVLARCTVADMTDRMLSRTGMKDLLMSGMTMEEIKAKYTLHEGRVIENALIN